MAPGAVWANIKNPGRGNRFQGWNFQMQKQLTNKSEAHDFGAHQGIAITLFDKQEDLSAYSGLFIRDLVFHYWRTRRYADRS